MTEIVENEKEERKITPFGMFFKSKQLKRGETKKEKWKRLQVEWAKMSKQQKMQYS